MKQTTNYQLSQWEAEDKVLRTDFNADNAKIDAAIHGRIRMVTGHYEGTGEYGPDHPNVIEIPDAERPPRVIIVSEGRGWYNIVLIRGMTEAATIIGNGSVQTVNLTWTDKGVSWYNAKSGFYQLNHNAGDCKDYYYAAFI